MKKFIFLSVIICCIFPDFSFGYDFGYAVNVSVGVPEETRLANPFVDLDRFFFRQNIDGRPFCFWYTIATQNGQGNQVLMGHDYWSNYSAKKDPSPLHVPSTVMWEGKEYTVSYLLADVLISYTDIDTVYVPRTVENCCVADHLAELQLKPSLIPDYAFKCWQVDAENPNYASVDGALLSKDGKTLYSVPFRLTDYNIPSSVEVVEHCAFVMNESPSQIPENVKTVCSTAFAFSSTKELLIPGNITLCRDCGQRWDYSRIQNPEIETSITIVGNKEGGTEVQCTFGRNIPTLIFGEGVRSIVAPYGACDIYLPNSLEQIQDLQNLDDHVRIHIPSDGNQWQYVDNSLFTNDGNLFYALAQTSTFTIPEGVRIIHDWALRLEDQVNLLILPSTLSSIGAVHNLYKVPNLYMYCAPPAVPYEYFYVTKDNNLYVLPEYVEAYKSHEKWGKCTILELTQEVIDGLIGVPQPHIGTESRQLEQWFTTDGRKMMYKPLQKGIYIRDGKKVLVK